MVFREACLGGKCFLIFKKFLLWYKVYLEVYINIYQIYSFLIIFLRNL